MTRSALRHTLIAVVVVALVTSFLPGCSPPTTLVDASGGTIAHDGVEVRLPPDAVSEPTDVQVSKGVNPLPNEVAIEGVVAAGPAVEVVLGDGQQPGKPITLRVPIPDHSPAAEGVPLSETFVLVSEAADGQLDAFPAQYDASSSTVSATVDHLSWFWPVQIHPQALLAGLSDIVLQSLSIESPKPECVDESAEVAGRVWSVVAQPAQAWVCISTEDDALVVTVKANSPLSWLVASTQADDVTSTPRSSLLANAVTLAGGRALGLVKDGQAVLSPDVDAELVMPVDVASQVTVAFKQAPELLLLAILATTLDLVTSKLDVVAGLEWVEVVECLNAGLVPAASPSEMTPEYVANLAHAIFSCALPVGKAAGLSAVKATLLNVVLTILSAGPQFLVAAAIGILNELTGAGRFSTEIRAEGNTVSPTEVITLFRPFGDDGALVPGYGLRDLSAGDAVDCTHDAGSATAVSENTHDCGTVADNTFACWAAPSSSDRVRCIFSPWDTTLVERSALNLPPTTLMRPEGERRPLGIELADGTRWSFRVGGAWNPTPTGTTATYGCESGPCEDEVLVDSVGTSQEAWTVWRAVSDGRPPEALPEPGQEVVAKAWFISAAPGPPANTTVWVPPYPFGSDDTSVRFRGAPITGAESALDLPVGAGSLYELRDVSWVGWGTEDAVASLRVRYCSDSCTGWSEQANLKLSGLTQLWCGEGDVATYSRYLPRGFPKMPDTTHALEIEPIC